MGLLDRFFGKKQPHLAEKQLQLAEVVELTSLAVMANCTTQVRAIIHQNTMLPTLGSNPDEFNKDAWDIVLELIAFSLHLADRIAFNAVGPEKRSLFMDFFPSHPVDPYGHLLRSQAALPNGLPYALR
jgi:hypothetical protein